MNTHLPNFLVLGAAKAGTTSLYYYLAQHPQVYMSPIKEPNFFGLAGEQPKNHGLGYRLMLRNSVTTLERYQALYAKATDQLARGEASTKYLYRYEHSAALIKKYVPQARMVAILRQPAERAYSQFRHNLSHGRELHSDFSLAIAQEAQRVREEWQDMFHYAAKGFYYQQLKYYYEHFDPAQIKVYLFDDLLRDPLGLIKDLFTFLQVDPQFTPDLEQRHNVTGEKLYLYKPRAALRWLEPWSDAYTPRVLANLYLPYHLSRKVAPLFFKQQSCNTQFPAELRNQLNKLFRDDILRLQDLLQRDLSSWLA